MPTSLSPKARMVIREWCTDMRRRYGKEWKKELAKEMAEEAAADATFRVIVEKFIDSLGEPPKARAIPRPKARYNKRKKKE